MSTTITASTTKPLASAKSASPAKRTAAKRKATTAGTASGRLAITILGGLALGLVAMAIYGMADAKKEWAFSRPEAQLPSRQTKHTLQ